MAKKPSKKRGVMTHAIILLGYTFATLIGLVFGAIVGMVYGAGEGPRILKNLLTVGVKKKVKSKALQVREKTAQGG